MENQDNNLIENNSENFDKKKFVRKPQYGIFAGIFAGLGSYFDINAIWLRLGFLFLIFASNILFIWPILAYFITWCIIPKETTANTMENESDRVGKLLKFSCLGCIGMLFFACIVIALVLIIPLGYLGDLQQIFPNGIDSFLSYENVDFNISYHPNIPLLLIGAFLVFIMPIIAIVYNYNQKKEGKDGLNKTNILIIVLIWIGGIFMIINSLTNDEEYFHEKNSEISYFSTKFEQLI